MTIPKVDVFFPLYRKNESGKNFYIVEDDKNFTEIQKIGLKKRVYHFQVNTYFDQSLLRDLIECKRPFSECQERDCRDLL